MQGVSYLSVSDTHGEPRPLHIFDLQPHLLEKIITFLDEDDRYALQATNKTWYWHVHQSKTQRKAGDEARLGLLQHDLFAADHNPAEQVCPLNVLTQTELADGNNRRASFLTECYHLSILRSEDPVRIEYDGRQRAWLPDFIDLLTQFSHNHTKAIAIIFVISTFSDASDISNFLSDMVTERLAAENVILSVETCYRMTILDWPSGHELHDYLRVANEIKIEKKPTLSAFMDFYGGLSSLQTTPLTKLSVFGWHLGTLLNASSRTPCISFPLLCDLSIESLTAQMCEDFQALFHDPFHQIRNLQLSLDNHRVISHLPLDGLHGLQRLDLRNCAMSPGTLFQSISMLPELKVLSHRVGYSLNYYVDGLDDFSSLSIGDTPSLTEFRFIFDDQIEQTSLEGLNGLRNLTKLDLSSNDLSLLDKLGFDRLISLEILDLSECQLNGETILSDLQNLYNLKALNLSRNDLAEVEKLPFSSLASLQTLDLSKCRLNGTDILRGLQDLTSLESLDLSHNQLRKVRQLPFGKLERLQNLTMIACELHGRHVLDSLRTMKSLRSLYLPQNTLKLVEKLPLQHMPHLKTLNMERCSLQGKTILDELENLRKLKTILLEGNNFSSLESLPFTSALSLETLDLRRCQLPGDDILDGLRHLRNLEVLNLSDNNFVTVTALPFGNMIRLRELNMARCHLTGEVILNGLRSLRNLSKLDVSSNPFQSVNRLQFDEQISLERVDLSNTGLSGEWVLQGLEHASQLQYLKLQDNDLSSMKSFPFQKWTTLVELRLDNCNLDGKSLVDSLPSLTSCNKLNLSGNDFSSVSVMPLSHIKNLYKVNLDHCNLRVNILDLAGLSSLRYCSMTHNEITDLTSFPISPSTHPELRLLDLKFNPITRDRKRLCTEEQRERLGNDVIEIDW